MRIIRHLIREFDEPERKVYMLHGDVPEEQMAGLSTLRSVVRRVLLESTPPPTTVPDPQASAQSSGNRVVVIVAGELEKKIDKYRAMEREFKYAAHRTILYRHFDMWLKKNGIDPDKDLTAAQAAQWRGVIDVERPNWDKEVDRLWDAKRIKPPTSLAAVAEKQLAAGMSVRGEFATVGPNVVMVHSSVGFKANTGLPTLKFPQRMRNSDSGDRSIVDGTSELQDTLVLNHADVLDSKLTGSTVQGGSLRSSQVFSSEISQESSGTDNAENMSIESSKIKGSVVVSSYGTKVAVTSCDLDETTLRLLRGQTKIISTAVKKSSLDPIGGTTVTACSLTNVKMDCDESYIGLADIADTELINVEKCKIMGSSQSRVRIRYAKISGSPQILGNGKTELVIHGFPNQAANIIGNVKISGSPWISGTVMGSAEISGNAKIHAAAKISGTCKVGGTAEMIDGIYATGTYTEGRYSAKEAAKSPMEKVADKARSVVDKTKSLIGYEDD